MMFNMLEGTPLVFWIITSRLREMLELGDIPRYMANTKKWSRSKRISFEDVYRVEQEMPAQSWKVYLKSRPAPLISLIQHQGCLEGRASTPQSLPDTPAHPCMIGCWTRQHHCEIFERQ